MSLSNPSPLGINAEETAGSVYELEVMDVSMESVIQMPQNLCPYEPTETMMPCTRPVQIQARQKSRSSE